MIRLLPLLLLTACTYPLPKDMKVTETLYADPMKLYAACGQFGACAESDRETYCYMHLPVASNGEPMGRDHEISECAGRLDAPEK